MRVFYSAVADDSLIHQIRVYALHTAFIAAATKVQVTF
jgi:hypothetical protein